MGTELAVEVKETDMVAEKHLKGLRALHEEGLVRSLNVVSLDPAYRRTRDGLHIWPWQLFLKKLWAGSLI